MTGVNHQGVGTHFCEAVLELCVLEFALHRMPEYRQDCLMIVPIALVLSNVCSLRIKLFYCTWRFWLSSQR